MIKNGFSGCVSKLEGFKLKQHLTSCQIETIYCIFCLGWAWVIFNFLGSQSLVFRLIDAVYKISVLKISVVWEVFRLVKEIKTVLNLQTYTFSFIWKGCDLFTKEIESAKNAVRPRLSKSKTVIKLSIKIFSQSWAVNIRNSHLKICLLIDI